MPQNQICAQRLYLTADKSTLVAEGDERAATLYATPGDEIPASAAETFGLIDGALPGFDAAAVAAAEAAEKAAAEQAAADAAAAEKAAHEAARAEAEAAEKAKAEFAAKEAAEEAAAKQAAKAQTETKPAPTVETKPAKPGKVKA